MILMPFYKKGPKNDTDALFIRKGPKNDTDALLE